MPPDNHTAPGHGEIADDIAGVRADSDGVGGVGGRGGDGVGGGDGGGTETTQAPIGDLNIGAFSANGPWTVDPDQMSWRTGIDALRSRVAAEAPKLVRRRRFPPGRRAVRGGGPLGGPLGMWAI